jgi:hypothetical protein
MEETGEKEEGTLLPHPPLRNAGSATDGSCSNTRL